MKFLLLLIFASVCYFSYPKHQREETKISMINQPLILAGLGGVGRSLVKLLGSSKQVLAKQGISLTVVAMCDSSGCIHNKGRVLDDATVTAAVQAKVDGKKLSSLSDSSSDTVLQVVQSFGEKAIVVDCSASDNLIPALLLALEKGGGCCFANKKPLTSKQEYFDQMFSPTNHARIGYESSVGAGTPMIAALQRLIAGGDEVMKVQGTFSGTLGYLMSGLQEGTPYSEVVKKAYDLGYTEPEPRDDLGGVDVGRKALILARTLGWKMEMKDVEIEPLYPDEFASLSVPDFLKSLHKLDESYKEKTEAASVSGTALRYVASVDNGKCKVGLKAVPLDSPIGRLSGTANMVEFYTKIYGDSPLVIQGAGAGGDVTAAGVLADIVQVANVIHSHDDRSHKSGL